MLNKSIAREMVLLGNVMAKNAAACLVATTSLLKLNRACTSAQATLSKRLHTLPRTSMERTMVLLAQAAAATRAERVCCVTCGNALSAKLTPDVTKGITDRLPLEMAEYAAGTTKCAKLHQRANNQQHAAYQHAPDLRTTQHIIASVGLTKKLVVRVIVAAIRNI